MNWKKIVFLCFVAVLGGYILGMFFPFVGWCKVSDSPITKGDYYGIFVNVFLTIATFLTVIVALWKESILRYFKHPQCEIELLDEGIIENIDIDQPSPQADSYECVLKIHNKGNIVATGCEVCISEVLYSKKSSTEKKPIRDLSGKKKLYWESVFLDIPPRISKELLLFKICSPNNFGTPNTNLTNNCRIDFNGVQIPLNRAQSGVWEIRYYMNYKNGESIHFGLNIEWDGSWKYRKSEMKDVLKIKITNL
ncbi:MAG: hypothetical protein NC250_03100 [Alistipes senegalensis]|nr:hypothetical protein [Bacteroides cellulosilyticus]MCM1351705.1 hypothetical protein [Alistipes senegalensis]